MAGYVVAYYPTAPGFQHPAICGPSLEAVRGYVPSGVHSLDVHFLAEQPLWAEHVCAGVFGHAFRQDPFRRISSVDQPPMPWLPIRGINVLFRHLLFSHIVNFGLMIIGP